MSDTLVQAHELRRLLEAGACDAATARVLGEGSLECARVLLSQGEAQVAFELLTCAAGLADALPSEWCDRRLVLVAQASFLLERYETCLELATRLRAIEEGGRTPPPPLAFGLRAYEGAALLRLHRVDEARELLDQLRNEMSRFPEMTISPCVYVNLSYALLDSGRTLEAREIAAEALVSARRVKDVYWRGVAQLLVCVLEKARARWATADESVSDAIRCFEGLGNQRQLAHALLLLGIVKWKRGHLEAALDATGKQIEAARHVGSDLLHTFGRQLRAQVLIARGDFEDARALIASGEPLDRTSPRTRQDLLQLEFLADVDLERGSPEIAEPHIQTAWGAALALVPRGDIVAELRRRRADCFVQMGKFERAHHEALEAIAHSQEISDRYEESATYRILALACAGLGRLDEARAAFDKGFSCYEDIETPYEWGKLWMSYGDWIASEAAGAYHDLNGAHEAFRSAANYFENIGAEYKLRLARERLAAIEQRLQPSGTLASSSPGARPKPLRRPREIADLHRRGAWVHEQFGIVTRNKALIDMLEDVARVAASPLPVLILGESGTGKELVAQGVQKLSGRRGRFVPVNAGALPDTMIEGELFGHVQGAFTNALREKEGLFEYADGGTIFLDEIGEMSVDVQAKLLRVLELGEIRRVGGTSSIRVDARIVAATNRDRLQMEAGQGFRADLYYRLSHAMFELPPLRQRGDDVEFLVEHFLDEFCARYRKRVSISPEAMERLVRNQWPGNVRQLRATMERLIVSARSVHTLMPREVPAPTLDAPGSRPGSLGEELIQKERQAILDALEKSQWVKADAARMLRMSRTTLLTKMKRLGIQG